MKEINSNTNFLEDFVSTAISKVEDLVKTKTVIGEPIVTPMNTTIIPVNKVSVGYVVGGGEYDSTKKKLSYPTCGGSGGGASISPIGFIVENNSEIKFIDVANKSAYQTILNLVNTIMSKFQVKDDEKDK